MVIADNDLGNTGIDDHALAHGAGIGILDILIGQTLLADEIQGRAEHLLAGSMDDGIRLRMNGAAELISLTTGNIQLFAGAEADVGAVDTSSGCAYIAGGDNLIVRNDDRTEAAAQAGTSLEDGLGDIQIIIGFVPSGHEDSFPRRCRTALAVCISQSGRKRLIMQVFAGFCGF